MGFVFKRAPIFVNKMQLFFGATIFTLESTEGTSLLLIIASMYCPENTFLILTRLVPSNRVLGSLLF